MYQRNSQPVLSREKGQPNVNNNDDVELGRGVSQFTFENRIVLNRKVKCKG